MRNHDGQLGTSCPPGSATLESQPSRLLAMLFEHVEPGGRLSVLNIGPALPETVDFLARYHCNLYIVDLLQETFPSIDPELDEAERLSQWRDYFLETLGISKRIRLDLIFLWDVLNFMSGEAIAALVEVLLPHLHEHSRAHCFAVHNTAASPANVYHGIKDAETLSVRSRLVLPADYRPHSQARLASLLSCFKADRSVLMRDQRTELLLKAAL